MFKLFKEKFGLSITLDTDLTVVDFLDVTFDLHNEKFHPFRKPNDQPLYIHKHSNHPPHVTQQLPNSINKRLSEISCDKESFDAFKADYEQALANSSLQSKLTYEPPNQPTEQRPATKARKRNVIWFTPPYSAALKTNLGKEFLRLLDKNFPRNNHLHKIMNRKTIKMSYSCTPNMSTIISAHNKKILSTKEETNKARCNCQKKNNCPVPGECYRSKVVYHATVQHPDGKKAEYIGCTEPPFKQRFANHKKSFTHATYKSETTLSKYIWEHGLNPTPNVAWKFLKPCEVYETGKTSCDLCLSEKIFIIKNLNRRNSINKRTDIGNKCPHKRKKTFAFTGD